jgi:hypothetical protein
LEGDEDIVLRPEVLDRCSANGIEDIPSGSMSEFADGDRPPDRYHRRGNPFFEETLALESSTDDLIL